MIYFFADNHYGTRPGFLQYQGLRSEFSLSFHEDDWSEMGRDGFAADCSLLLLNMIGDTCSVPHPGEAAERQLRAYVQSGRNLLLLHGSSAAFWQWEWWRRWVGLRWVRGNDPDGVPPSTHPVRNFRVDLHKSRHPLCRLLSPMEIPEDEIYIHLEETGPIATLMTTRTDEGTFPQCYECLTPWGGRMIGFLPGHRPEVAGSPVLLANIRVLLLSLLSGQKSLLGP